MEPSQFQRGSSDNTAEPGFSHWLALKTITTTSCSTSTAQHLRLSQALLSHSRRCNNFRFSSQQKTLCEKHAQPQNQRHVIKTKTIQVKHCFADGRTQKPKSKIKKKRQIDVEENAADEDMNESKNMDEMDAEDRYESSVNSVSIPLHRPAIMTHWMSRKESNVLALLPNHRMKCRIPPKSERTVVRICG